jgi:CRISPR/Cas system-associated exonuclease Cas4 (RecB family)
MSNVNDKMIYECFSELYYNRIFKEYTDKQASVYETCQCLLKSFYQRKLRYKLMDNKLVILSFGNLVHEALKTPLEKRGFKHEKEGVMSVNGIELFAHGDAVRDDCGIDHKTITRMPHAPLIHHFYQTNAYIHVFGTPKWYINYVHKPSGTVKVFPIEPLERAFQWNCLRAVRLCACLQRNLMPKPEPSWLCQYCEYKSICPVYKVH